MENSETQEENQLAVFVIGDPHFKKKDYKECEELIERCVKVTQERSPDLIIILGDVLDTHEVARNGPWKQACRFIELLADIAPTYVLMGNHDLINQSQFLTDNHFFGPLKRWKDVTIVDVPIRARFGEIDLVLSPYVPPGRLVEALDTLLDHEEDPFDWKTSMCIFCHQEFEGIVYGGKESEKGDKWSDEYPRVISGHIHTECELYPNIYYTGSSRQVDSNEEPDKKVWSVTFPSFTIEKIDLELKSKKDICVLYEDLKKFDVTLADRYYVKLKVKGTSEEFKALRKSALYSDLTKRGVMIAFDPIIIAKIQRTKDEKDRVLSFEEILNKLVATKKQSIQDIYAEIYS